LINPGTSGGARVMPKGVWSARDSSETPQKGKSFDFLLWFLRLVVAKSRPSNLNL
jgi:hypothetical protein